MVCRGDGDPRGRAVRRHDGLAEGGFGQVDAAVALVWVGGVGGPRLHGHVPFRLESHSILLHARDCCEFMNGIICKNCINGHQEIIKNNLRKARCYFKKGSRSCNICDVNTDFKKRKLDVKEIFNNESDGDDFVNGIDMYCLDFSSSDCNFHEELTVSKLCVNELEEMNLIMIKRRIKGVNSCVSIQEINQRNEIFRNNLNLYVGDDGSSIFDDHQISQVFESGKGKYITILNEDVVFLISDDKIIKWYIGLHADSLFRI